MMIAKREALPQEQVGHLSNHDHLQDYDNLRERDLSPSLLS